MERKLFPSLWGVCSAFLHEFPDFDISPASKNSKITLGSGIGVPIFDFAK
jgi:hypothetical protein